MDLVSSAGSLMISMASSAVSLATRQACCLHRQSTIRLTSEVCWTRAKLQWVSCMLARNARFQLSSRTICYSRSSRLQSFVAGDVSHYFWSKNLLKESRERRRWVSVLVRTKYIVLTTYWFVAVKYVSCGKAAIVMTNFRWRKLACFVCFVCEFWKEQTPLFLALLAWGKKHATDMSQARAPSSN